MELIFNNKKDITFTYKLLIIIVIISSILGRAKSITLPNYERIYLFYVAIPLCSYIFLIAKMAKRNKSVEMLDHSNLTIISILCLFIFLFYGLLTSLWSDYGFNIEEYLRYVIAVLIVYCSYKMISDLNSIIFVAKVFMYIAVLFGILAIYESLTGNYFGVTYSYYSYVLNFLNTNRPVLIFTNTNNCATFFALSIPVCHIALLHNKKKRFWQSSITIMFLFIILLTESRMALYTVLVFILLGTLLSDKINSKIILFSLFIAILIIIGLNILDYSIFIENYSILDNEIRWLIWKDVLQEISNSNYLGIGVGNLLNVTDMSAHNYVLELMLEFGLIGGAIFVMWQGCILIRSAKLHKTILKLNRESPKGDHLREILLNIKEMLILFILFTIEFFMLSICPSSMAGMYYLWLIWGIMVKSLELIWNFLKQENVQR